MKWDRSPGVSGVLTHGCTRGRENDMNTKQIT